jgi:hypothetical protein
MKSNIKIILSSILLLAAVLLVIWKISAKNPPSGSSTDIKSTTKHERAGGDNHASQGGNQQAGGAAGGAGANQNNGAQAATKEVILEKIQEASTTYDAAQLPIIKPHLLNADPEIRKAAINGMVVLGDAAASPMLREAAKQMNTAEDMKVMLEAAEYLELPSANLKEILKNSKKKKATPPEVPSEQNQTK